MGIEETFIEARIFKGETREELLCLFLLELRLIFTRFVAAFVLAQKRMGSEKVALVF